MATRNARAGENTWKVVGGNRFPLRLFLIESAAAAGFPRYGELDARARAPEKIDPGCHVVALVMIWRRASAAI